MRDQRANNGPPSRCCRRFTVDDSFLYFQLQPALPRLCVPDAPGMRKCVLFEEHNVPTRGHPGQAKTLLHVFEIVLKEHGYVGRPLRCIVRALSVQQMWNFYIYLKFLSKDGCISVWTSSHHSPPPLLATMRCWLLWIASPSQRISYLVMQLYRRRRVLNCLARFISGCMGYHGQSFKIATRNLRRRYDASSWSGRVLGFTTVLRSNPRRTDSLMRRSYSSITRLQ